MSSAKILNPDQITAITHGEGPLLIVAGAGTGKTTVITERIKHLVVEKKVSPTNILALTFTEKAATEMEERIDIAMPYGYTQMWISTFHAFCDRILRNEAIHIGLDPGYKLTTEAEAILFLRKNLFKLKLDYFRPLGNPTKFIQGMLNHFSRLNDEDVSPDEYLSYAEKLAATTDTEPDEIKKTLELAHAYKTYEQLKAEAGMMDFSNLIANTLKLFRTRKNVLKSYQEQFHYILLDEFQDTNFAQNQLALLLTGERRNITVVGDDDQAIYRWRGAALSNIIQFRDIFKDAKIVTLTKNYRSTQGILDKAYTLITNNNPDRLEFKEHIDKHLKAERLGKGFPPELIFGPRAEDEAELVVKKIQDLVARKKNIYKDIAILVRANDHSQAFVRTLERYGIPYQFLGPGQLFHREEIKDLIAYLKVLANFEDTTSLYRVLNIPIFMISPRNIATLLNYSKRKNLSLFATIEHIAKRGDEENSIYLEPGGLEKLQKIVTLIHNHLARVSKDTAGQILYYFLQDSGLLRTFLAPQSLFDEKKAQNITKLFEKLKTFETEQPDASVFAVVEWIDLSMQMGESPLAANTDWAENNAVNILTIHSSKGLEFPVVFLVNLVAQRFPTRERREQVPIPQELIKEILPVGDYHMQEERRLFYVGMTRAKDALFLTAAHYYGEGKRERKISPFVYESLGLETVETTIAQKRAEKLIVQPSLLDWAPNNNETTPSETTPDRSAVTLITYLSYSQLQTFEVCPLHYKLKYILKLPSPVSPAQSFGTSVHAVLRDYYLGFIRGDTIKSNDITTLLKQNWVDDGYSSKTHEENAYEAAKFVLTRYIEKYFDPKQQTTKTLAVEIPFKFFIDKKLTVGGRIDRIDETPDGKIEIIDYKTGNRMLDGKNLEENLQLTTYALALSEIPDPKFHRDADDILLTLMYLDLDTKMTTTRTKEQLEELKQILLAKADEIANSDFSCSKSVLCENCEYKMLCSTYTS